MQRKVAVRHHDLPAAIADILSVRRRPCLFGGVLHFRLETARFKFFIESTLCKANHSGTWSESLSGAGCD